MKKHILIICTSLFIFGQTVAKKGLTVINETGKTFIAVKVDKMEPVTKLQQGVPKGWERVEDQKFIATTAGGKRAVYWMENGTSYKTEEFTYPEKLYVKTGGTYIMSGKLIKKKERTAKKIEAKKIATKEPGATVGEKIKAAVTLPINIAEVAKEAYKALSDGATISEVFAEQTEKIKALAKQVAKTTKISDKVSILRKMVADHVRPLVIMGAYPLLDRVIKILNITNEKIVRPFSAEKAKEIEEVKKQIQQLRTKSKEGKTLGEYLDVAEKIMKDSETMLKNPKTWIKN